MPGGTFRENLRREKDVKTLPSNHPGARFRYNELKERFGSDKYGDITIKRTKKGKVDELVDGVGKLEVGETAEAVVAKA